MRIVQEAFTSENGHKRRDRPLCTTHKGLRENLSIVTAVAHRQFDGEKLDWYTEVHEIVDFAIWLLRVSMLQNATSCY